MSAAAFYRPPQESSLTRFITVSFIAHILVLIGLSLTISNTIHTSPSAPMQVKLIGVPQPTAAAKPVKPPEEVRTQDSAAPKEPPKEMKNIPDSKATTKMLTDQKPLVSDTKPNPMEAQKRPPVLDKNPNEKKVVKNDLTAKVVKDPEDFLKALDYVDKLAKPNPKPAPAATATEAKAGEGPTLQLNLADDGAVNALRDHIAKNWLIQPGMDTRGLSITVLIRVDTAGNLTYLSITQSSGNPAFDASLDRAIRKSQPLPIPADKYDKFKELELVFQAPQ